MQILLGTGAGYKTQTLKEIEELALQLGYDGVELMPPPMHVPPGESQRDTNYASLTHAPVMHAIGDIYDQPRFRAALDASLTIAQQNNIHVINIHPASATFGGRQNVLEGIQYIKEVEKKTGLTVAYEMLVDPHGVHPERQAWFQEQQAYTSLEDWIQDVIEFDLHATIDTCHAGTWHKPPAELIKPLGQHLTHIHFSDFDQAEKIEHVIPGTGQVELKEFLHVLAKERPAVTLTVEINPGQTKEEVKTDAKQSLHFIHQFL